MHEFGDVVIFDQALVNDGSRQGATVDDDMVGAIHGVAKKRIEREET